jgi:hypothetical protein
MSPFEEYLMRFEGVAKSRARFVLNNQVRYRDVVLERRELVEQSAQLACQARVQINREGVLIYSYPSPHNSTNWLCCTKTELGYFAFLTGGAVFVPNAPLYLGLTQQEKRRDGRMNRLIGMTKSFVFGDYEYVAHSPNGRSWQLKHPKPLDHWLHI